MINLVLECIDRLHVYSSAAHFTDVAGKEAGESWKSILNSLYELLGMIHISSAYINIGDKPADCDPVSSDTHARLSRVLLERGGLYSQ